MTPSPGGAPRTVQLPAELFSTSTFGTLGGCAVVTWVVTTVLGGLLGVDAKGLGLVVAIAIAYVGVFLSAEGGKRQYVVAFFNGFLIYLTVVGSTSFLPYVNRKTASVVDDKRPGVVRPWVPDRNLVAATKDLLAIKETQSRTLTDLRLKLETTRAVPAAEKSELLRTLSKNQDVVRAKTSALNRVGIAPHD